MSLRSSLWRYLGLLVVAALAVGVFAGPASAKKLSAKQKASIRKQLRKQVKKNPKIIKSKRFAKRAALVNFKLPITIRLRTGDVPATPANESAANNPNRATLDLGASLGQREVNLGGSLAAEITFRDSYDGGALGNVDLDILPSTTKSLTTTSIPLLWNTQVSQAGTRFDIPALQAASGNPESALSGLSGCGNWLGSSNLPFAPDNVTPPIAFGFGPAGLPGYPFHSAANPGGAPEGFLPIDPGVDDLTNMVAAKNPGDPFALGGNPDPFPYSATSEPITGTPSVKDTVLRTAPLKLQIAGAGTQVTQGGLTANPDGVNGSQNIVIGKSGGQANLFGNIPGKAYGIDVTVSLATKINSILRIVDQQSWGGNLIEGEPFPAGVFNCRQVYTGAVQNYIPDVRLTGNLKIAPGITSDGRLRIAKATIASQAGFPTRFAVAACLAPYAGFNQPQNGSDTYPTPGSAKIPTPTGGVQNTASLPADVDSVRTGPDMTTIESATCNQQPTGLVATSALPTAEVSSLAPAAGANGYTVTNSGSAVSVAADLNVNNVSVDVLIGDTP